MGYGARNPAAFAQFLSVIQQYNASGERFRIDSHCQSACTMFLSIRNVCVTPGATLLFHAGGSMQKGIISPSATQQMLSTYNAALQTVCHRQPFHGYVRLSSDFRQRNHQALRLPGLPVAGRAG